MPHGECYRVGSQRRMTGVLYRRHTDEARFFADRATPPEDGAYSIDGSLAVSDHYKLGAPQKRLRNGAVIRAPESRSPYLVTFWGRETAQLPSRWLRSVVVIDRIENIRRLDPPAGSGE